MKRRLVTLLFLICLAALLPPLTVSAEAPQNGWVKTDGDWYYYQNGAPVTDQVLKIGTVYYGFNEVGIMYDDELFWCGEQVFGAKPGGALYVNQWVQDGDEWFYFGAEGKAPNDFTKIGGVWYFFDYGYMCHDQIVWSIDYQGYFVIKPDGADSKRQTTPGWHQVYGSWYYMYHNGIELCPARDELKTIGGKTYYFDSTGKMAADGVYYYYDYQEEIGRELVIDKNGYVIENGWAQIGNYRYYVENGGFYRYDIYEIDGKLYAFDENGRLKTTPGEFIWYAKGREIYIKDSSGVLLRNAWRKLSGSGWAYYGASGQRYHEGMYTIGGKLYFFQDGIMLEDQMAYDEEGLVYLIDKNGYATIANGWFQHPESGNRMYAEEGRIYRNGAYEIHGKIHIFDYEGFLSVHTTYDDGEGYTYLLDAEGTIIKQPGWHKAAGHWYYVENEEGHLLYGWQTLGGISYLLYPEMAANTIYFNWDNDSWYFFHNDGKATKLSGTGWWQGADNQRFYLENGKPLQNTWKQLGKDWYYFDSDGAVLRNGICEIEGTLYLFDWDGKWVENGWYQDMYAANGRLVTGLQTINGKKYLFEENGKLYPRNFAETGDGTIYWLNGDGSVKTTLKDGWNQIGAKWYYYNTEQGELMQNSLLWKGDICYGFGSDFAMCTNGVQYAWYDYYMFDANGKLLTGWHKFDGKWYYADPESSDPFIYSNGIYNIDGETYYFQDGYMQVGTFTTLEGIITTNASGAITKTEPFPDGYTYVDGQVIYRKSGEQVTGWVGNYYFEGGIMKVMEVFEQGGKHYFAGKDGSYAKNGWQKISANGQTLYLYAKADGTLLWDEWFQQGSTWYYFKQCIMMSDTIIQIDGQYHRFDTSGKWLGQISLDDAIPALSDGWHQISGNWYYYHAGRPVNGRQYIGGVWYCFENYVMLANDSDGTYYYGASGARLNATGWKQIDGKWYYFHDDHSMACGLLRADGGYYFFVTDMQGPVISYSGDPYMISNQGVIIHNALYIFNASGFCKGPETGNGWRQAGSDWFYLVNGIPMRDTTLQIGNSLYAFDYEGKMVTNTIWEVPTAAGYGYIYFNGSGAAVTKAGWMQLADGWIYIASDGFAYYEGLYKIGNSTYYFLEGYWVQ